MAKAKQIEVTIFDIDEQVKSLEKSCISEREQITYVTYSTKKSVLKPSQVYVGQCDVINFKTREDCEENICINIERHYKNTNVDDGEWKGFKLTRETKTFI